MEPALHSLVCNPCISTTGLFEPLLFRDLTSSKGIARCDAFFANRREKVATDGAADFRSFPVLFDLRHSRIGMPFAS